MVGKMPGDRDSELNNLRAAYGFMAMHPGKKLLFMGQEFATFDEWNEKESLDWDLLQYQDHSDMQGYVKALNSLIKAHPALYADDCRPEGSSGLTISPPMKICWYSCGRLKERPC